MVLWYSQRHLKIMKKIKIPKGAQPKSDQIRALTRHIEGLTAHFAHDAERFHDGQSKRPLERLIHKRGLVLAAVLEQDPDLHQKLTKEIQYGRRRE